MAQTLVETLDTTGPPKKNRMASVPQRVQLASTPEPPLPRGKGTKPYVQSTRSIFIGMLCLLILFAWVEKASLFKASFLIFCLNIIKLCKKYLAGFTWNHLMVLLLCGSFLQNDNASQF